MSEPDPSRRIRRLRVRGDADAVRELVDALTDARVAGLAAMALADLNASEAVPALIAQAHTASDEFTRADCAYTLGRMDHPEVFPALLQALNDPAPEVTQSAVAALGLLGDERAVPHLKALLNRDHWRGRADACQALLELKVADEDVEAALERLASEPEADTAGFTIENLRREFQELRHGPGAVLADDPAAEVQLARHELADERVEIRIRGVHRLREVGGNAAVSLLRSALNDPAGRVRAGAALAIGGLETPEAVPDLIRLLRTDASNHVRLMCAVAFTLRPDPDAFDALVEALRADDWKMVTAACTALARLGDLRAAGELFPLLTHPGWGVRLSACVALLELRVGDNRIVDALRQLAREPEAEEHDLVAAESRCGLDEMKELAAEMGDPEPEPFPTLADFIARARVLTKS